MWEFFVTHWSYSSLEEYRVTTKIYEHEQDDQQEILKKAETQINEKKKNSTQRRNPNVDIKRKRSKKYKIGKLPATMLYMDSGFRNLRLSMKEISPSVWFVFIEWVRENAIYQQSIEECESRKEEFASESGIAGENWNQE